MTIGSALTGSYQHSRERLARLSRVLLTQQDIYHFREGTYVRAYQKLGAHAVRAADGTVGGTRFAVWAPNAAEVAVIGDFNGWDRRTSPLAPRGDSSGIWEGLVQGVGPGALYKYHIASRHGGHRVDKSDPYAFRTEVPPRTASIVWDLSFEWHDEEWLRHRAGANALGAPWSIYEVHLGSWRRVPEEGNRYLGYRELAPQLADYASELGFTHVELLPVMEHPFYGSWGYQVTGYFAPSARYGTPQDFMYFVEHLHRRGIGVILEWIPNRFGGHENLEAVEFIKQLNLAAYRDHPDTQTIAEESTAWPMVSRPTYLGGLGFGLKWNMGWMHDTLEYFQQDPVHRKYHHSSLTFSLWYAFTENFVLPLSHDEVVHGKGALLGKMPGDEWQQFASLRLLFGYMWTHPGKKLLFMGGEFGQRREWQHEESLEWHVLEYPLHAGVQRWVRDLNRLYRSTPALHQLEFSEGGFQWIDCDDADVSVISFLRRGAAGELALVACNFTPVPREAYRIGVPRDRQIGRAHV